MMPLLLSLFLGGLLAWLPAPEPPATVPADTLVGKVICGYQGWFACPGDPLNVGWIHWSRSRARIAPDTLTFEMWPDMSDYSPSERYPAPGFTYPDGKQACLFSSQNSRTVLRHFEWMAQYGLDGAEIQRFVVGLQDPPNAPSTRVLHYARAAAEQTGRVFSVGYDLSGMRPDLIVPRLERDWHFLVDSGLTASPRYLHHAGKPVVGIFGFYSNRFPAEVGEQVLKLFHGETRYQAFVIGSGEWWWRKEQKPGWQALFASFDAYRPWNVGNVAKEDDKRFAATATWPGDLAALRAHRCLFQPVLYPGFSWDNLKRLAPGTSIIPRLKGAFFWRQFLDAAQAGVSTAFLAMFDEVDEGTAIFKVTNSPPTQAHFVTYEGLPSDYYLQLAGRGTRLLHSTAAPPAAP